MAFQLVLGEERAAFDADAVAEAVIEKMQRRHPHLYGLGEKEDWETLKARERAEDASLPDAPSLLHGVASGLDPLSKAHRIQDRVAAVGFDWEDAMGAFEKVTEELEEVREQIERRQRLETLEGPRSGGAVEQAEPELEEELGDLLFAVVNLSRLVGTHALMALHGANAKFTRRFAALERRAAERAIDLESSSLDELEELWSEVKAEEGP